MFTGMLVNTGVACKGRDCGGVPAGQTTDEILHREDCQPSRHRELRKAENLWPTLTVGTKVNSCTPLNDRSLILDQRKRGTSLLGILIRIILSFQIFTGDLTRLILSTHRYVDNFPIANNHCQSLTLALEYQSISDAN